MPTNLEAHFMRKGDAELLEIARSEDYRPEAQQLAKALLLRRQLSAEMIEEWRDPTADFAPKPWALGKSGADLRRMFKRRWLVDRLVFWLLVTTSIFSIYKVLRAVELATALFVILWCFPILYLYMLRPLLHGIFYWRTPLQILLLRPFEFPKSRERTRRFARTYLCYLGLTYTLSDTEVKPRILETLLSYLPVFPFSWCWASRPYYDVKEDEDVRGLKEFINRRLARNIAWGLSWDRVFTISCTPQTWKRTVQHLINNAQLIVLDLSHAGEGLKWELDEVRFYHATGKMGFVCYEDYLDAARTFLESYEWSGGRAPEVFAYGNKGLASSSEELIGEFTSLAASFLQVDNHPK